MSSSLSVRKPASVCRRTPTDCSISPWYAGAGLLDSYAITMTRPLPASMRDLASVAIATPPAWLRLLFRIRDAWVRPFGVKTTSDMAQAAAGDARIEFFHVRSQTSDEIVLGDDDLHLSFRLSLLRRITPAGTEVTATTVVRINNGFGRFYIFVIAPFHRLVVRTSLRRLASAMAG